MDSDDFARRYEEQTARIRQLLAALDAGPQSRMREFTALEVVCQGCGEALFRVVNLRPYRVLRMRGTTEDTEPDLSEEARRELAELAQDTALSRLERASREYRLRRPPKRSVRRGAGTFIPLAWPPRTEDRDSHVHSTCHCQAVDAQLGTIYDALVTRRRKVVWPAPTKRYG